LGDGVKKVVVEAIYILEFSLRRHNTGVVRPLVEELENN